MTSEEIQQKKLSLLGEAANTIWLQEIAYQLAVMNERAAFEADQRRAMEKANKFWEQWL
jgi:hypothetical protein